MHIGFYEIINYYFFVLELHRRLRDSSVTNVFYSLILSTQSECLNKNGIHDIIHSHQQLVCL